MPKVNGKHMSPRKANSMRRRSTSSAESGTSIMDAARNAYNRLTGALAQPRSGMKSNAPYRDVKYDESGKAVMGPEVRTGGKHVGQAARKRRLGDIKKFYGNS